MSENWRSSDVDNDELGRLGEIEFDRIATSANLTASATTRDRAGWDFFIDDPMFDKASYLDSRRLQPEFKVQVKSKRASSEYIEMRLSTLERLAKSILPSFIVVIDLDDNIIPLSISYIHILGDVLASVLKKLREVEAKDARLISRTFFRLAKRHLSSSYSPRDFDLRAIVKEEVGEDPLRYASIKSGQLKSLGFEPTSYVVTATVMVDPKTSPNDYAYGDIPIPILSISARERRFGVDLPARLPFPSGGHLLVTPQEAPDCTLLLKSSSQLVPIVFRGSLRRPSIPIPGSSPLQFKTTLLLLNFSDSSQGVGAIDVQAGPFEEDVPLASIKDWRNLVRFGLAVSGKKAELTIRCKNQKDVRLPLSGATPSFKDNNATLLEKSLLSCEKFLTQFGIDDHPVSRADIERVTSDVAIVSALIRKKTIDVSFTLVSDFPPSKVPSEILFVRNVRVGSFCLSYYSIAKVRRFETVAHTTTVNMTLKSLRDTRAQRLMSPAIKEYEEEAKAATGVDCVFRSDDWQL